MYRGTKTGCPEGGVAAGLGEGWLCSTDGTEILNLETTWIPIRALPLARVHRPRRRCTVHRDTHARDSRYGRLRVTLTRDYNYKMEDTFSLNLCGELELSDGNAPCGFSGPLPWKHSPGGFSTVPRCLFVIRAWTLQVSGKKNLFFVVFQRCSQFDLWIVRSEGNHSLGV